MTFISSSFQASNPGYFPEKSPVASADALNTMLYPPGYSLVTPDYPERESVYASPAEEDPCSKEESLCVTNEVLTMTRGTIFPGEQTGLASLAPRPVKSGARCLGPPPSIPLMPKNSKSLSRGSSSGLRLNKFVRRLHDMLQAEKDSGLVEWRRGLLVLYSTDGFAKRILPKYFNTQNFKTFRRQLNYYGFVHVRSFSTTGSATTALWVNRELAKHGTDDISSVLKLKRVEPCEGAKTAEGRRQRKEQAIFTVEEDIGVSAKTLQMEQIRSLAMRGDEDDLGILHAPLMSIQENQWNGSDSEPTSNDSIRSTETCEDDVAALSDGASASAANVLLMLSRA